MQPGALMLDLETTALTAEEKELLLRPGVGGVILFSRNLTDTQQAAALLGEIRALRPELLLAIDQEGGRVQRLQTGLTRLPALRHLGQLETLNQEAALQAARLLGQLMAQEIAKAGFDFSFAPVLDLDYGKSEVIGDRAFSQDPDTLSLLAREYIAGMQLAGMAAIGKHYPGHGYVAADSHVSLPQDMRSLDELRQSCLKPFAALSTDLQGIMPAHIIYPQVDSKPAGFSSFWLNFLRQELGFTGVIFSDDLSMAGAEVAGDYSQRAEAALEAGCDQVLVCNNRSAAIQVLDWLDEHQWPACEKAQALKPRLPVTEQWLDSPEAILARKLAEMLRAQELQAAVHLLAGELDI